MPPGPLARAITGGVGPDNDFLIWGVVTWVIKKV